MIFVFGSNTRGIHGRGAAWHAYVYEGAIRGLGEGRAGNSYALPTKWAPIVGMELADIDQKVVTFLDYARQHPNENFKITQVGCGLGGYTKEEIAPLFGRRQIPPNCYFDLKWKPFLPEVAYFWGTL